MGCGPALLPTSRWLPAAGAISSGAISCCETQTHCRSRECKDAFPNFICNLPCLNSRRFIRYLPTPFLHEGKWEAREWQPGFLNWAPGGQLSLFSCQGCRGPLSKQTPSVFSVGLLTLSVPTRGSWSPSKRLCELYFFNQRFFFFFSHNVETIMELPWNTSGSSGSSFEPAETRNSSSYF